MNLKKLFRKLGVRISVIFHLTVMAGFITVLYTAPFDSFGDSTFQTFLTIYTFISVFFCYMQLTTSIRPENSRDLENIVVLVLLQVQITVFSVVLLILMFYYSTILSSFLNATVDNSKDLASLLASFLLMASVMIQLGWCGYLAKAVGPRLDFSSMEFVIPESEFLEEEDSLIKCD